MTFRPVELCAAIVLWIGATTTCSASTSLGMRCGVDLVSTGQYTYEVLYRCGEPVEQHVKTIYRAANYRDVYGYPGDEGVVRRGVLSPIVVPVEVEEWIYDFGPHRLRRRLLFEDGQLVEIETLDRGGYAPSP